MNLEFQIDKSQHAYFVEGGYDRIEPELKSAVEEVFGVTLQGNPDYRVSRFEVLGIDEARSLKEEQGRRTFGGGMKFFVIGADSLTREAQNALLKVLEEPTEGTYLFLVVPSVKQALPTLLSRVRIIKTGTRIPEPAAAPGVSAFLAAGAEKRLQLPFVKKLIEEKDKQPIISFLGELEAATRAKLPVSGMAKEEIGFLSELIKMRSYAGDRSSSVKMILEHIALTAPVIA